MKIRRALISVSDEEASLISPVELQAFGIEIVSTGGTAYRLQAEGISTLKFRNSPALRRFSTAGSKPCIPRSMAGFFTFEAKEQEKEAAAQGLLPIDLVVVNLYPFEATVASGATLPRPSKNDIGGPSMIRSAAKNFQAVTVVTDPADYAPVLEDMKKTSRWRKPRVAGASCHQSLQTTAAYDRAIAGFLNAGKSRIFRPDVPLEASVCATERIRISPPNLPGDFRSTSEAPRQGTLHNNP
jgi:phosphoribosylaminoimidazolecarboxamide formyltransferase/IMP cyclohydrolase